jgi:hypothetical protein
LKTSVLYRIASVLLLIFAVGHTLGFRLTDPKLGLSPVISSMQTIHFDVQGFSRTYWDFYVGFGLFVTLFLLFAALLAWQLSRLNKDVLAFMRGTMWGFAICFVAETIVTWSYFFIVPIAFSVAITACLIGAALLSTKRSPGHD